MDFKGITWLGNVYQKFEAMCLEVEEVIYEDTVKYVENQVQTVGASVKKFYLEVVEDVLPPSSIDPVKFAAADLSLNPYADFAVHKIPKANTNDDNKPVSEFSVMKTEAMENCTKDLLPKENRIVVSDEKARGAIKRKSRRENSLPSEGLRSFAPLSRDLSSISTCCKERLLRNTSPPGLPDVASAEVNGATGSEGVDSLMGFCISCDTKNGESALEDFVSLTALSPYGKAGEYNVNFIRNNDDKWEPMPETIQEFDESSCVVVGREDFSVAAPKEDKPRSYKKKIQRAISSKWLARKQEYKQLAVQHGGLGTGSNLADSFSPKLLNGVKSSPHRILESEWEFL